jgi:hypothetical protein
MLLVAIYLMVYDIKCDCTLSINRNIRLSYTPPSVLFLLSLLTFLFMFNYLSYLKY